ncbi:hypothetical protein J2S50_007042 [Streptomyces sp. DSM 40167]|nr:hypothetical protein [Streptomyces sp. DSM 40167]
MDALPPGEGAVVKADGDRVAVSTLHALSPPSGTARTPSRRRPPAADRRHAAHAG